MDFEVRLSQFVGRVASLKDSLLTEEATKTSLIMPFFSLLGYDVFDPSQFLPEFIADVGIKRGEKVDYAILKDGQPVIIIEAKSVSKKLDRHDSQLFRYFATTKAKFAILTNGIHYRFFTDLDNLNKMDELPFFEFDLLNLRDSQIEEIKRFQKADFNIPLIFDSASFLKCKDRFKEQFSAQLETPSDEFIKLFLRDIYSGVKTQSVLEKFRPIMVQAMQEYIQETMSTKLKAVLSAPQSAAPTQETPTAEVEEDTTPAQALPTEMELAAYERLKAAFKDYISPECITIKKTDSYVAILCENNVRKWICRLILSEGSKTIILPDGDKKDIRRYVSNLYELENYRTYMISVAGRYIELLKPLPNPNPKVYEIELRRRFPKISCRKAVVAG